MQRGPAWRLGFFDPPYLTDDEIADFNAELSSPREILVKDWRRGIFFHEEPTEDDLVKIKLFWG
jgi:hypothetical protein